jgi:hypothetical protein
MTHRLASFAVVLIVSAGILLLVVTGGSSQPALGSAFAVTNTNDAGAGSLRQAIMDANVNAGHDAISFSAVAFPEAAPGVITPVTALPPMTDPDGTTVDGSGAGVVIDGSALAAGEDGLTFHTSAGVDLSDATVRNLTVRDFPHWGIFICGGASALPCINDDNFDPLVDGVTVTGNGHHGIFITGQNTVDATVTNSTMTGNGFHGLEFNSCTGDTIGATLTDSVLSGNNKKGVEVNSCDDVIGTLMSGNTASLNGDSGFYINAGNNVLNPVASDNASIDNGRHGFEVNAADNVTGAMVRGNTSDGSTQDGVYLNAGQFLDDATVMGNLIRNNMGDGVYLSHSLGSVSEQASINGNVICGNVASGLNVDDPITVGGEGNWWGDASGPAPGGFAPWIATIMATAELAVVAAPRGVSFQFSDAADTVFLGEGLSASHPFMVTTDNGTLTSATGSGPSVSAAINAADGTLAVTLTPTIAGPATVALTGPCALDNTLGGNSIIINVAAQPSATPMPSPTPDPDALIQGDNDCDGDADSVDALKGLQHLAAIGFSQEAGCPALGGAVPAGEPPDVFGDVDCDGDVDSVDGLKILQFVAAIAFTQNEPCTDIGESLG